MVDIMYNGDVTSYLWRRIGGILRFSRHVIVRGGVRVLRGGSAVDGNTRRSGIFHHSIIGNRGWRLAAARREIGRWLFYGQCRHGFEPESIGARGRAGH